MNAPADQPGLPSVAWPGSSQQPHWRHRFAALGAAFYTPLQPQPFAPPHRPHWVGHSADVAASLGWDRASFGPHAMSGAAAGAASQPAGAAEDGLLLALSGHALIEGSRPLASVYSGHQFGVWAGQLGDGRAILLGETASGLEVQLKGAGLTPYSRMGDGRAVLRSSIREFLCSEAMYGLGIPTTRALCVTGCDAPVRREEIETAAVVTRVAPSFIRFGHFEHFSHHGLHGELRTLADFVIQSYYPECLKDDEPIDQAGRPRAAPETVANWKAWNPYTRLLHRVSERTAALLAQWQCVGFCHGVMNTDNMSILGLTIDYGPFQFMDGYNPAHICNHSDHSGRYAYGRQPNIAYWNLYALAQALLPLLDDDAEAAQNQAVAALESYKTAFPRALEDGLRRKLSLPPATDAGGHAAHRSLIESLLKALAAEQVDWTIFLRRLSHAVGAQDFAPVRALWVDGTLIDGFLLSFQELLVGAHHEKLAENMLKTNPKYVLRNHLGEEAIVAAKQKDFSVLADLQGVLQRPFDEHPAFERWAGFPPDWAKGIEISCSS